MNYKSDLKCGDLQGINDGLMSLGGVISFSPKHDLLCYFNFKLQAVSAFVALDTVNLVANKILNKKEKAINRNYNRC